MPHVDFCEVTERVTIIQEDRIDIWSEVASQSDDWWNQSGGSQGNPVYRFLVDTPSPYATMRIPFEYHISLIDACPNLFEL